MALINCLLPFFISETKVLSSAMDFIKRSPPHSPHTDGWRISMLNDCYPIIKINYSRIVRLNSNKN